MLELHSPYDIAYPSYLVKFNNCTITELSISKLLINGKLLDVANLHKCKVQLLGTVINNIPELLRLSLNRNSTNLLLDTTTNKIVRCNKALHYSINYKLIEQVYDDCIYVSGIPHPIRHSSSYLQSEGINRVILYAELAIWNNIIFFIKACKKKYDNKSRKL